MTVVAEAPSTTHPVRRRLPGSVGDAQTYRNIAYLLAAFPLGLLCVVVLPIGIVENRYVQLAHLQSASVQVDVGQQITAGQIVDRCGNSGFSLEPHLHMQIQDTPDSNNHHSPGDGDSFPIRFSDITHIRDGVEHDEQTSLFRRNDRVRTEP